MCVVDLVVILLMIELLGMLFEVVLVVVLLNGFLYLLYYLFGDLVVFGWIMLVIFFLMVYCVSFLEGEVWVYVLIVF